VYCTTWAGIHASSLTICHLLLLFCGFVAHTGLSSATVHSFVNCSTYWLHYECVFVEQMMFVLCHCREHIVKKLDALEIHWSTSHGWSHLTCPEIVWKILLWVTGTCFFASGMNAGIWITRGSILRFHHIGVNDTAPIFNLISLSLDCATTRCCI